MSNLLEITGEDVTGLKDADLRALIGLLCEADYRMAGLPTKGITWGGHQDARDSGLDVVVRGEMPPPKNSFVPRNNTGFQVKKPDMPRSEILKEMRPNGSLREEIKRLIREHGAYVIVSASGSMTDSALRNRIDAMKEAVADEKDCQNLRVDFLDRGRVATWLRSHPSLILWVRRKIGRELTGWQPYGNWTNAPEGIEDEYLLDDGLRLHDGTSFRDKGVSAKEGLERLRSALSTPGISVRLTGLSGVGKTRLVQAMFDERVGKHALNSSQAFYTDISDNPNPDPRAFAEQLIADKMKAILIVDNCPPDLHRRLTQACSGSNSTVSLMTVEYDVRDDLPDETSVFRLEPASDEIIQRLVEKRFPHISQVDAKTIAGFAGGNARVAIALANTVQEGETLSGFHDEELFKRLFRQRHEPNDNLLISAEICSLVYSFQGTDADSEESELRLLASLIAKSGSELYRDVNTLRERDLVQARGAWRAVLPHAIANRLAKRALASIPKNTIVHNFLRSTERLIKSFTRRLSYLHDCDQALEMANDWLAPDGWIGKETCNLNDFGMVVFRNIAPVAPEKTLEAIERAAIGDNGAQFTSRENTHYYEFVTLLWHLAYDRELFRRSVDVMCRYALSEKPEEKYNSTRDILKSLFYIHLSGTYATIEERASVIEGLVDSGDHDKQELGLSLLDAALETWYFSSFHDFGFGARPRDYGYYPKTEEEAINWYTVFIGICTRLALLVSPISQKAKEVLCDNLRGLWTKAHMFEVLGDSVKRIHEQQAWNEAWIAVREVLRYDGKGFKKDVLERLRDLERRLRPYDLLERARTFALSDEQHTFDLEEDFDVGTDGTSAWERMQETTQAIGVQVAEDPITFGLLLPVLVSTHNSRLYSFGRGLADGCSDKKQFWQLLRTQYEKTSAEERKTTVLRGFLSRCVEMDPPFYNATLDEIISDELFGESFPEFQLTSAIDAQGVERLNKALDAGRVKISTYQYLAYGRAHESISDDDLAGLLEKILLKEEGLGVVIEILKMRFHTPEEKSREYSKKLIAVGRSVLLKFPFSQQSRGHSNEDYELVQIGHVCLNGEDAAITATEMCRHLVEEIANNNVHVFDYPGLINLLARLHPILFLDVFVENNTIKDYQRRNMFADDFYHRHGNPLDQISQDDLISWCNKRPESRYSLIALVIQPFSKSSEADKLVWKPIVHSIFEKTSDLGKVLEHLAHSIIPTGGSDSLADLLEERLVLFQDLYVHHNAEIRAWAKRRYSALQEWIKRERELEKNRNRKRSESFE
jgi:hypothetical protein